MFTFKAYDPGIGKFINIESDNSKISASPEAQHVSVPPSSSFHNLSTGLLALNNYVKNIHDLLSSSIVRLISSFSPLLDNRDPQIPFLSRPPTQMGFFSFDNPSYSLPPVSALPPDYPSIPTPNLTRPVLSICSPRSTASPTLYASPDASFTSIVARLILSSPAMISRPFSLFMRRANVAIWTVFLV